MEYGKELVTAKLYRWQKFLTEYSLPRWEELPAIKLYMDQVMMLLNQYLSFMPKDEDDDKIITASIINNYVRMKVIPPPEKKRYSRIHLAYLLMICVLKQSLNIAYVQSMIPMGLDEDAVSAIYNDFVDKHCKVSEVFISQVKSAAAEVIDPDNNDESAIDRFVLENAVTANLYKLLTEKLVKLKIISNAADAENAPQQDQPDDGAAAE